MENYNEIGRRLVEVCNKLDEMGVFYGNNYDGKFHEEYPHCSCSYKLSLDKHRGGFMGLIYYNGDPEKCLADIVGDNPSLMIVEVLEKTYETLKKELGELPRK